MTISTDMGKVPLPHRLLVVDDEEIVCQIVQGFLVNDGWDVEAVRSLGEANRLMETALFPVVLLDVHLNGNSSDFLRQWKSRRPAVQFIMFTGDPSISTVREALQLGAYEYIPKPCRREELGRVVQRAFEKAQLLHEQERLQEENESYRRRLEELVERRTVQLRESELRYRAIFDRAVDAIFVVEAGSCRITDCNAAARRLLGLKTGDITGRPIAEFAGDQLSAALSEAVTPGHGEWRFERVVFRGREQNPRIAQVAVGKVDFDGQLHLQIIARDITSQVELLEQQALMETELLNEQRLSAIGQLASGIAHNINTPLMGIYGAAQLIKLKHPEVDDADSVISQVERINDIIRNLVWKSRHEQDHSLQALDLNQLIREELRFLDADLDFKHNVEKALALSDDVPAIMGRYGDFSQSLMNIVRNAMDSMQEQEHRHLLVRTEVRDGDLRLSVRDTGCGIKPEDKERIFLPFYTTRPNERPYYGAAGKGLGLAAVRKLMAPYDARFEIEDVPGGGTVFTICLPLQKNSASAQREASIIRE